MDAIVPDQHRTWSRRRIARSRRVTNRRGDCFLERLPEGLLADLCQTLQQRYGVAAPHLGRGVRLANCFLGIQRELADELLRFARQMIADASRYPLLPLPEGFALPQGGLTPVEEQGGFTFGYFDAALTRDGLRIIEAQAFPTYHLTAALMSCFLCDRLAPGSSAFAYPRDADWHDFVAHLRGVIAADAEGGVVLTDLDLARQKTAFESDHAPGARSRPRRRPGYLRRSRPTGVPLTRCPGDYKAPTSPLQSGLAA